MKKVESRENSSGQRADRRALAEINDLIDDGVFEAASVLAWEVQRETPGDPAVWLLLTRIDYLRERYAAAMYAARMATRLDPSSSVAWLWLARTAVTRARWRTEGLDAALQATALAPADPDTWTALAQLHLSRDARYEAAIAAERAVRVGPANIEAHRTLGLIAIQAGEWTHAAAAFRRVLQLDAHDAEARSGLAEALRAQHIDPADELAGYGPVPAGGAGLGGRVRQLAKENLDLSDPGPMRARPQGLLVGVALCLALGAVIGVVVPGLGVVRGLVGAFAVALMWVAVWPLRTRQPAPVDVAASTAAIRSLANDASVDPPAAARRADAAAHPDPEPRRADPAAQAEPEPRRAEPPAPPRAPAAAASSTAAPGPPAQDEDEREPADVGAGHARRARAMRARAERARADRGRLGRMAGRPDQPEPDAPERRGSPDAVGARSDVDGPSRTPPPHPGADGADGPVADPGFRRDDDAPTTPYAPDGSPGSGEGHGPPAGGGVHDASPGAAEEPDDLPGAADAHDGRHPTADDLPETPEELAERSRALLAEFDLEAARAAAERLAQVAPGSIESYRALGAVSLAEQNYAQAEVHYAKVLEIEPLDQEAHERLAMAKKGRRREQQPSSRRRRKG